MPAETYFLRAHRRGECEGARRPARHKTKVGETPEGYEIFQPRGKFQFPVKKADLTTILSHLGVKMDSSGNLRA